MNNRNKPSRKEIEQYLASREEEFLSKHDTGQGWDKLQRRIAGRRKARIFIRTACAAACLAAVGGIGLWMSQEKELQPLALQENIPVSVNDFPEKGESKAILLLGNGEKIRLDQTYPSTGQKDTAIFTNNRQEGILTYRETADSKPAQEYNTLVIPKGGEYQLVLSDGTQVWLNSESSLKYPVSFKGENREVELNGEALFHVTEDTASPFTVRASNMVVEGDVSKFNVAAYPQTSIKATLAEGNVKVKTPFKEIELSPNQQAILSPDNRLMTRTVDAHLYTCWTEGIYEFRNTSLEEITAQLSRWYDVDMQFKYPELKEKHFAGVIFRKEELNMAIETIQAVSNVQFVREGNVIYIDRKGRRDKNVYPTEHV